VSGVYVTVQVLSAGPELVNVHATGVKVPVPPLTRKFTVPVGGAGVTVLLLVSLPVSWTVAVQVVDWLRLRTLGVQLSVVVVTWPAVTVVVPEPVSRLKKPLQATAPGTQSLTDEPTLLLALVSVWRPTIPPLLTPNALSGNDASIDAAPPLLQPLKLQVWSALPTTVRLPVPNGVFSTSAVGRPFESNSTHALASGVPSRFVSTKNE
jgi:hypothetical protein